MKHFFMVITFLSGNFFYQLLQADPDYLLAIDRSFFQAVAIIGAIIYSKSMINRQ